MQNHKPEPSPGDVRLLPYPSYSQSLRLHIPRLLACGVLLHPWLAVRAEPFVSARVSLFHRFRRDPWALPRLFDEVRRHMRVKHQTLWFAHREDFHRLDEAVHGCLQGLHRLPYSR